MHRLSGAIEFTQGSVQGLLLAAENAFGGLLDLFSKTADPLACLIRKGSSGFVQTTFEQLRCLFQAFAESIALGLSISLVKFLRENGLAGFRFRNGFLDVLEEFFESLSLLLPILREGIVRLGSGLRPEDGVLVWLCFDIFRAWCCIVRCGTPRHALLQLLLSSLERVGLLE